MSRLVALTLVLAALTFTARSTQATSVSGCKAGAGSFTYYYSDFAHTNQVGFYASACDTGVCSGSGSITKYYEIRWAVCAN
jgi:hypothetical protein